MPIIVQKTSEAERENDETIRFQTYYEYINSISYLLQTHYPSDDILADSIMNCRGFRKIKKPKEVLDSTQIFQFLSHSWFTEVLLKESADHQTLFPYMLPWSMVQTYYATHALLSAYFWSTGRKQIQTHTSSLCTISTDSWSYKRFPPPWNAMFSDDPELRPVKINNVSEVIRIRSTVGHSYQIEPWQIFGKFLLTTRKKQVKAAIEDWKEKNHRKKIFKLEREQVIKRQHPITIFDALYRLRLRSNYQDIDSYLFNTFTVEKFIEVHESLLNIIQKTSFLFEMIISKIVGKNEYIRYLSMISGSAFGGQTCEAPYERWKTISSKISKP